MSKIEGSGSESISQRHGSADPDPDPHQNVMDKKTAPSISQRKNKKIGEANRTVPRALPFVKATAY
jgi:hypothetical protein